MTSEQFQSNPKPEAYDPFRGGPFQSAEPPRTVMYAYYLMLTNAVLTVVGMVYGATLLPEIRREAREMEAGSLTGSTLETIVTIGIGIGFVISVITVVLWIWIAFASRAGKNWARITGTVLFGVDTLSILFSITSDSSTVPTIVINSLSWVIDLAIVILWWGTQSSAYFRPAPESTPPSPGPGQPGPWNY
ncbi:hypothetical protein ACQP06_07350 [Nocardia sp. CA-136227]|uniref:hypothetical protein n=1 Tax=Nocardia sp. CA-136227 TaxID=3239979 RepID=UPI003D9650DB